MVAFKHYHDNEFEEEKKKKIHVDKELMAKGYEAMSEINLEEAHATEGTWNDIPFGW
ncbi:hypothetical protein AB1283_01140 [Bacillus sp. S13(2024)]|uniref:hypothetical protein n=1 Tax=Bacillus sp. S13(2024) TaxID=3162885 RepID=UPI003D24F3CC